jgi:uncharacterized protein
VTSVKLSHIPEDKALTENGLKVALAELGLEKPWLGPEVSISYEMRLVHGKILANFTAQGTLELQCSRCLEAFQQKVSTKFLIEFEETPEEANPRNSPDPEDAGLNVVFFSGDDIEFGDEVRQELELLIPFAPLCRKDCLGLCPVCGANRNEKLCGCDEAPKNNPFTGLNKLFQQNKEN